MACDRVSVGVSPGRLPASQRRGWAGRPGPFAGAVVALGVVWSWRSGRDLIGADLTGADLGPANQGSP